MKTRKTITLILALLMALAALPWQKAAAGAAYDPNDIAVINGIINAHPELRWPKAPADGSSVPNEWTGKVIWTRIGIPRFVEKINLSGTGISGALNVSRLRRLNTLNCYNNGLTELNVSGLGKLETLNCYNNGLTELNVSGLGKLETLNCYNNGLTELNVSGLGNLKTLNCYGNSLTALDVSGLGKLETLNCYNNGLTELDVSGLSVLQNLYCYNNQLTGLNVSGLTNLQKLYCYNNQLTGLNVSGLTNLQVLSCNDNQLTGLNVSGLSALTYLSCNNNQLTGLNVSGLTNLQELHCNNNQLTGLNVSGLTNLQVLSCYNNQLTGLNVSGLTNLQVLSCNDNQLTGTLDVSGLTNLQELYCHYNQLTGLNVSGLTALTYLDCYDNQLTGLNVSGLTALEYLYCHSNQLTGTLDVSGLTNLQQLYCYENQLTGLNVSGLTNLQELRCIDNQLTGLNVSGLTNLQVLYCEANQLTGLNVSGLSNLQKLYCYRNQLTGLNVSGLTNLQKLSCNDNQLTGLNVSGLSNLQELYCAGNQLTGLNVSGLSNLQVLHCDHNYMADRSAVTGREIDWDGTNFRFDPQYVFLSFTAEQTGGANGTADSTGIKLTFNKDVTGLPADEITLTNGTGAASKGNLTGSAKTWNLALAQVTKPGDIYVSIANFGEYIVTGDALPVWVHKAGVPVSTVTVTGGTANGCSAVSAAKDAVITLTADAAPGGQHFAEWNISPPVQFTDGTSKQSSTAKFIMPAENVTAEAIYAGEFNRADIAAINNIIANNGLSLPQAPADGFSVPNEWNGIVFWTGDATNRRVVMLDISDTTGLTGTLDVSSLSALRELYCERNQLTGLNVSGLTALQELYCELNQLTGTLDVSGLTSLRVLRCYMNQLTGLVLDQGAPYSTIDARHNYMANTGAITGRIINWDSGNFLFSPQYRRISYDANGGSRQMQAGRAVDGEAFTLPENGFTAPSGQQFKAWAIGDVNGPQKKAGEQHTFNADTTVYAIWHCPVTGVTLNKNTATLTVGGSETLTATVAPENATNKDVTWSSDKPAVATVDQSGKVIAVAPGTATITVKTVDGGKTATCAVTVVAPVTGVSLKKTATSMVVGGAETLFAIVTPANATNKSVTWSSDKPAVATVDNGGKVTAVAPGTAAITVKTVDGGKTAACTVTVSAAAAPVTGVKLNKASAALPVGGAETLYATVEPATATNQNVTWSSDKPAVATVDAAGKVTAKAPGTAAITVKTVDGGKTAACTVTVVAPVTGVKLNKAATALVVGGAETLFAALAPANATNKAVTWSSDNTAVATVDNGGKVIAVAVGTATITVKTADGGKTATCTVTVSAAAVPVTGVKLNKATAALPVGGAERLAATVEPAAATNQNLTWSSNKPAVATVDAAGKVTAKAPGTAAITVTTQDGGKTAACTVTVSAPVVPVTGVKLNKAATALLVGGTETLYATVEPATATNKAVTWSSDNTAIATVDNGGKVIAVAVGTATITVKTADGGKTATCTVTVSAAAVPVTGVKLNKATAALPVGGAERLAATVEPAAATNQNLTWSSDKPDVAAVDQSGKVIAVAPGTATITVTTADGGKTAACTVTVSTAEVSLPGDVNMDGAVDILDAMCMIDYLTIKTPCPSPDNADTNQDESIDILDLLWIINNIVG